MANDNTLFWIALAAGAYFLYTRLQTSQTATTAKPASTTAASPGFTSFETCMFPDGTTIPVIAGSPCPFDPAHGGQSIICFSADQIGPPAPGVPLCLGQNQ